MIDTNLPEHKPHRSTPAAPDQQESAAAVVAWGAEIVAPPIISLSFSLHPFLPPVVQSNSAWPIIRTTTTPPEEKVTGLQQQQLTIN